MEGENRSLARWPTTLAVVCSFTGQYNNPLCVQVRSLDVGEGGIRLLLPEEPKGKEMKMRIYLPYGRKPIFASGEVVWTREKETEEGKFFETGIRFTKIEPTDKQKILFFVYNISGLEEPD